jgi:hypothetical protein
MWQGTLQRLLSNFFADLTCTEAVHHQHIEQASHIRQQTGNNSRIKYN